MDIQAQLQMDLNKDWIMFLNKKIIIACLNSMLFFGAVNAQDVHKNHNSLEIGLNVAGAEALYYGANAKFIMPLSQKKHHSIFVLSLTSYADLKGESEAEAYLRNDMDIRIIPALHLGYSLNFKRLQLNFELPIGASIAITKGRIINEKAGFKRDFSNQEIFLHYGVAFSPKYRINQKYQIGIYGFLPLVSDKARSGYVFGIGLSRSFLK